MAVGVFARQAGLAHPANTGHRDHRPPRAQRGGQVTQQGVAADDGAVAAGKVGHLGVVTGK